MPTLKRPLPLGYMVVSIVVGHHFQPIATDLFVILFAVLFIGFCLQIYFMPVKRKLENIARLKVRHGIPLDQPHNVDRILKEGFFKIP